MRQVLFIISSDPRTSHRPAEALRIAAGSGAWGQAIVNVCLSGPATRMLDENVSDLRDEDQIASSLSLLSGSGSPIYVYGAAEIDPPAQGTQRLDLKALAELAMRHDVVARF